MNKLKINVFIKIVLRVESYFARSRLEIPGRDRNAREKTQNQIETISP